MKKLISLLAAVSVVSACSLAAFATDFTVDYDESTTEDNVTMKVTSVAEPEVYTKGANNLYNVDLTTVANGQAQTTILAVEGTTIKVGTIKYINQSGTPSFSFDMDNPSNTVYVLAGGSTLTPTLVGTIEAASTEPETFTISGTVTGYLGTTLPTAKVYNGETVVAVGIVNSDGTFEVANVPIPAEDATYSLKLEKVSHFSYIVNGINSETTGLTGTMIGGAVNDDNIIEISDIVLLANRYGMTTATDGYSIAYDLNEDGTVEISDIVLIANRYGSTDPNVAE